MKLTIFTILFACSLTITAFAQNTDTSTAASSQATSTDLGSVTDVRLLFKDRETLINELRALDLIIEDLSAKISGLPPAATLQRDLQKLTRDLENAQKAVPLDQQRIDALQRAIDSTNESLQIANSSAILPEKKSERDRKRDRLFDIEQRIASLFDATRDVNQFRSGATWAFTGLVLVVVGGFFFIAYRKDGIAAKIFSGEMGMQFVTLFLIVIAIILFGIMGTLEGRELAALLGGLSGYILGKAGLNREEPNPNPNPNPNPDPNANPNPDPNANPA